MKDIKYKITFFSNWHCGSGQAAGADVDELVVKDRNGLPYVPGRTVKGLLHDACKQIYAFRNMPKDKIQKVFGCTENKDNVVKGCAFFSNATLPLAEQKAIIEDVLLKEGLYHSVTATAIDGNGIAKDKSLRKIQTVIPCTLEGEISGLPEDFEADLEDAMGFVKRMGLGRNHGLGRCCISIIEG